MKAVFDSVIGPWGATFLLLVAVIVLWRERKEAQAMTARQQDLFEEALKLIRDDILPLVRELSHRR